jgi:hypothetical protein
LVARAGEALGAAHAAAVVHRSIRPSRLLRVGDEGVKVVGFRPGETGSDALKRDAGDAVAYLSPEQVKGAPAEARSDLFSLAAVLFELLTGKRAFPGESESSVLYRIVHEAPLDLEKAGCPIGAELATFLGRALSKSPDDRFPTAEAFVESLRGAAIAARVDGAFEEAADAVVPAALPATLPPAASTAIPKRSPLPLFVVGAFILVGLAAAGIWTFRDSFMPSGPPAPVWLETLVRTEPPDLEILLDGEPLAEPGRVRFQSAEPFGLLTATHGCRTTEHRLDPADAGQTVVLVADPAELAWSIDPAVPGATVSLNGAAIGTTPREVRLDLCRENRLEVQAAGYRPAIIEVAAGATPLEARKLLYEISLEQIPRGRLVLRVSDIQLVFYLDGRRLGKDDRDMELEVGDYRLRYKNEYHWIDRRTTLSIHDGQTLTPDLPGLGLTSLVVQAFPANCKVYVRKRGEKWRYIDETPATRRVAPGRYEVKVVLNPTGEERLRDVELVPGDNPPLRVAFGKRG